MSWFNVLQRLNGEARMIDLADEIASKCRHAVWARVCHRVMQFERAEARGYIRARAASIVKREIDFALEDEQIKPSLRPRLTELTIDSVIGLVFVLMQVSRQEEKQKQAA